MSDDKTRAKAADTETREGKVMVVGGGTIVLAMSGGDTLSIPANVETERWAGGRLHKYIKIDITLRECM